MNGFSVLMNKKAKELGLLNTNFVTPHGLDADEHYTTAYELATLANYALKNETFAKIVGTKNYTIYINGYPKNITNTNELLGYLDGVYGVKTGFTNGANRCLVSSCKRDNLDIICVVLGADTKKDRTNDSIKLIKYAYENFEMINLSSLINDKFNDWSSNHPNFTISKGINNNVIPKIDETPYELFPINKNNINNISININCNYNFEAPLKENAIIGYLYLYIDDNNILTQNFYNSITIEKKSTFDYFKELNCNLTHYLEFSLL